MSMSIRIDKEKCISCGRCLKVCPGSLIYKDENKKVYIKYPSNCWGCTACLKECPVGAIEYYLGADIGGNGGCMYTEQKGDDITWHIRDKWGKSHEINISRKDANKY